jgi:hypothetical protein
MRSNYPQQELIRDLILRSLQAHKAFVQPDPGMAGLGHNNCRDLPLASSLSSTFVSVMFEISGLIEVLVGNSNLLTSLFKMQ